MRGVAEARWSGWKRELRKSEKEQRRVEERLGDREPCRK